MVSLFWNAKTQEHDSISYVFAAMENAANMRECNKNIVVLKLKQHFLRLLLKYMKKKNVNIVPTSIVKYCNKKIEVLYETSRSN